MQKNFDKFLLRLKELQGGESVSAFARRLEMPQNTLDCYMRGVRKPSVELLTRVCDTCQVSADWLLGLSDVRTRSSDAAPASTHQSARFTSAEFSPPSSDLLKQIRQLEFRVKALETQPSYACG